MFTVLISAYMENFPLYISHTWKNFHVSTLFAGIKIMNIFLTSPIPIFLAVILFTIFSWPKFSKKIWAKVGRLFSILLFASSLIALFSAMNAKIEAGQKAVHSILVSRVTKQAETLIDDGEYSKAKLLLNKFNKEYEIVGKNREDLELFVNKLLKEASFSANKRLEQTGSKPAEISDQSARSAHP